MWRTRPVIHVCARVSSALGTRWNHAAACGHFDYKHIIDNLSDIQRNCKVRNVQGAPDIIRELYATRNTHIQEVESLRRQRNITSKARDMSIDEKRAAMAGIKSALSASEAELSSIEQQLQQAAASLPNATHPDVPEGAEDQARLVATEGQRPEFNFTPRDHLTIGMWSAAGGTRKHVLLGLAIHTRCTFSNAAFQLHS